jgi:hypothetical protein
MTDSAERRSLAISDISKAVTGLSPEAQTLAVTAVGRSKDPQKTAASLTVAANAANGLDPAAQTAAMQAQTTGIVGPDLETSDRLWTAIVYGLLAVLIMALIGLIALLIIGKTPDTVVTVFTAALTGLLGLFVTPPKTSQANSTPKG